MKSWASVLLQVERLHLSLGLPKWMSRPTGMPVALPKLPKRVQVGFQRIGPPDTPPLHHRDDTTRERGRPARMLSLRLPLSFPAMRHPATLPAETAWARPKQSHGAVAVRLGAQLEFV